MKIKKVKIINQNQKLAMKVKHELSTDVAAAGAAASAAAFRETTVRTVVNPGAAAETAAPAVAASVLISSFTFTSNFQF